MVVWEVVGIWFTDSSASSRFGKVARVPADTLDAVAKGVPLRTGNDRGGSCVGRNEGGARLWLWLLVVSWEVRSRFRGRWL